MPPSLESRLEELLTSGSDTRIVAGMNGLNRYGCSPLPRQAVPFGSCTCSSPSQRCIERATSILDRLRNADDPQREASVICNEHRARMRELLTIPADIEIAFAPSGTDAELLSLALVMLRSQRPILNIVVGPTEVGSGTSLAAAGRHYDCITPRGDSVSVGQPVCADMASQVRVCSIDIRDDRGRMLEESLIDASVVEAVSKAVDRGEHVLLHVVAHSKTGMHAPSLDCVERISRHVGEHVSVVIDAAQGRVSRRGLRDVLSSGHMVIFTGSKFYGGPPFSGALLIPPKFGERLTDDNRIKLSSNSFRALEQYFAETDLPESWGMILDPMSTWTNYGSILRWGAALAEIEAYYSVSDGDRLAVLRSFERDVPRVFQGADEIQLLPVFPPIHDDSQTRLLESKTSVFAFQIEIGGRGLSREELSSFHRELNNPSGSGVSGSDDEVTPFHLGQPVGFRNGTAALRIALGGALIVRIATDRTLGDSLSERLNWQHFQLQRLRRKIQSLLDARRISGQLGQ